MARQFDAGVRGALRGASAVIVSEGDAVWDLALADGSVPARGRTRDGWFEVTAPLPEPVQSEYDDLWGARFNSRLHGPARIVRGRLEAPCVRADVFIERDNPFDRVATACLDVTLVVAALTTPTAEIPPRSAAEPDLLHGGIQRACSEAGWHAVVQDGSRMRVEIPTRAGIYSARTQSSPSGDGRLVVELADLSGYSAVSTQAVSALLMAVSAAVRSIAGLVFYRESAPLALLSAPLETPLDGSVDRALSALSVACGLAGRETVALGDPQLASQYLALRERRSPVSRKAQVESPSRKSEQISAVTTAEQPTVG